MLSVGKKAINFKLKDKDGNAHILKEIKAKYVVIYFYPKDSTPGCTLEALEFNMDLEALHELGASVIGISGGDEKSKQKFCDRHKLNLALLSDPDFSVSEKYGVYGEKKFMGRPYMGISRVTFILDKDKKIIKVFEKVNPLGHAKEVFDFIKSN